MNIPSKSDDPFIVTVLITGIGTRISSTFVTHRSCHLYIGSKGKVTTAMRKISVLISAGSLRASFQLKLIEPLAGSTESHWLNWSFCTPVGSSLTRTGALQLAPRSVEWDTKISVPFDAVSSIQEQ